MSREFRSVCRTIEDVIGDLEHLLLRLALFLLALYGLYKLLNHP
jgi:hypothetical protein